MLHRISLFSCYKWVIVKSYISIISALLYINSNYLNINLVSKCYPAAETGLLYYTGTTLCVDCVSQLLIM